MTIAIASSSERAARCKTDGAFFFLRTRRAQSLFIR
jgi:hypothetical protein